MKDRFRIIPVIFVLISLPAGVFAQENASQNASQSAAPKFALVIGNSNYSGLTPLVNPVNDANDIAAVLQHLGFTRGVRPE